MDRLERAEDLAMSVLPILKSFLPDRSDDVFRIPAQLVATTMPLWRHLEKAKIHASDGALDPS